MRIERTDLLSGLLLVLLLTICLVLPVSADTGMPDGTDNLNVTPAETPDIVAGAALVEIAEEITEDNAALKAEAEPEVTPEPEATEIVIEESDFNWDGSVVLVKGHNFKYSPTTNPTAEYEVNSASDLAALEIVAEENGFEFYTGDSWYETYKTFSLTGIADLNSTVDFSYYWSIYVNGVSAPMGLSGNILEDGDLLQFCYGYSNYSLGISPTPSNCTNMVNITVDVHENFNYEGEVSLNRGPDFKYSPTNNPDAEYDVNATSDLAALKEAGANGGFEFYTSDSGYATYETFSLTGIGDLSNEADWSYYWGIYVNGVSAPAGFSGNMLNDGDLLQFAYGYSNYTEGIFPSPTTFDSIINLTVSVHDDFNWEGEVVLNKGPDFNFSATNDPSKVYEVNATSDLAALKAAAEKGGFEFFTDDAWYESYGSFSLTGIADVNVTPKSSYYWGIYINGVATQMGLSGNILENGDLLQFCYGYSDWAAGTPSPTDFDNIVNVTVNVHDDFNWEGSASLSRGPNFEYSTTNNPSQVYKVNTTSDLAALKEVADNAGFEFYTDDSWYETYQTFTLTGINGINNTEDWSYYWSIYINGDEAPTGFSANYLNNGDLLQFCYGYSNYAEGIFPTPTEFENIINITVDVHDNFNWEGDVALTRGPNFEFSSTNNPGTVYEVNATSDLAALKMAAEHGDFEFYTDDSWYESFLTFTLNGIEGVNQTDDFSYYWGIYINGKAAETGLSGNYLEDGDLLQFCYGYSDYMKGVSPSPTDFDNIVNITVYVHDDFNWEGEVTLSKGPDVKFSPTNDPTAEYDLNSASDLAALLKAADEGGFDVATSDSWYPYYNTFSLTGIENLKSTPAFSYYWSLYINGKAAEMGLSGNILEDGDLLQFAYGYSDYVKGISPTPTSFDNIVNITVKIEEYSGMAMILPSKGMMEDTPYTTQITVANITAASGVSTILTWNPDVIEVLNITANTSVFSGSAIYLNLTDGYADVALTNTGGITTTTPAPVFDVEFRSKTGLHATTLMSGTDTQYSDMSFNNHTLQCRDGCFRIERIKGDFNGNNIVDIGDVSRVAYMVADKTPKDMEADFNENGRVEVGDAAIIAWYFVGNRGSL